MSDNPEPAKKQNSEEKIIAEITTRLKAVEEAQGAASEAQKRHDETDDPEEKAHALEEKAKQEKKAKSELKIVQRLQSGVWQGGAGGAGIGAGVGMGVGTVVGSLVGGVTAIPTTGLGALVGVGTGAIHGPWFKVPKGEKEEEQEAFAEDTSQEALGEAEEKPPG